MRRNAARMAFSLMGRSRVRRRAGSHNEFGQVTGRCSGTLSFKEAGATSAFWADRNSTKQRTHQTKVPHYRERCGAGNPCGGRELCD